MEIVIFGLLFFRFTDPCSKPPRVMKFKITQFYVYVIVKNLKNCSINVLKRPAIFFLTGRKAQWDEGSGRILLGDNNVGGVSVLRPIRFQCVLAWISTGLPCINILILHRAEFSLRSQPVNFAASHEIPRIYGTRKFLTVPTSARHLSLFWSNSIQSPRSPPTSEYLCIYICTWLNVYHIPSWPSLKSCTWSSGQ
jgi:hypothetical protein